MATALLVARLLGGGYFVWSGSRKIGQSRLFWTQIMGYQISGPRISRVVASVVPVLELTVGLFFAAGLFPVATGTILLAMLLVFSVAVIVSLARKLDNDCGCAGAGTKVSPLLVLRNAGLAVLVFGGIFSPSVNYEGGLVVVGVGVVFLIGISVGSFRAMNA